MLAPLFRNRLKIPAMAAPLFLLSGPELVIACTKAGIPAAFPSLNHRTSAGFAAWLREIKQALADNGDAESRPYAPYGVNLIVHATNKRLNDDLEIVLKEKVPYVITSLGAVPDIVARIHDYGGIVLHDVTNKRHAEKALEANVDGIIAVCAGAGGHAGRLHPFAFLSELKPLTGNKMLILSGAISTGGDIAAAIAAGADMAYMGTRFIATDESRAQKDYKDMIIGSGAGDIVYTDKISGVPANFMAESLIRAGIDLEKIDQPDLNMGDETKAWADIWSAGQGVSAIKNTRPTAQLVAELADEFHIAKARLNTVRR